MKPWLRWAAPVFAWAAAFFTEVVAICISSHYYVVWMKRITRRASNQDSWMRDWMMETTTSEGALFDVLSRVLGGHQEPAYAAILQKCLGIGMLIYIIGCCFVKDKYGEHNSRVWTKVCIVASFLCIIRGTIFLVTMIPASRGWSTCEYHMSAERQDFYLIQLNFKAHFWLSITIAIWDTCKQLFLSFPFGFIDGSFTSAYCSESLALHGNSALIMLLCLASIEVTAYVTQQLFGKQKVATYDENERGEVLIVLPRCFSHILAENRLYTKRIVRFFSSIFFMAASGTHIYWIIVARKIYTMEFLLDLLFTLLLYTNVAVATFVYQWTGRKDTTRKQVNPEFPPDYHVVLETAQSGLGSRSMPIGEASPLIQESRIVKHRDAYPRFGDDDLLSPVAEYDNKNGKDRNRAAFFSQSSMDTHQSIFAAGESLVEGEILLPPCCPLKLCESGRYHVSAESSNVEIDAFLADESADFATQASRGCFDRMLRKVLCTSCINTDPNFYASFGQPNIFVCVAKWCIPFLAFICCFYLQNVGLHIGTHYYIRWMKILQARLSTTIASQDNPGTEVLSSHIAQGSLHDVFADYLGFTKINLIYLDVLTVIIPVAWTFGTIYTHSITLWTKCWCCACCLALGKGIMAFSTVIPDSIGWTNCKERLGPDGIELYYHGFAFGKAFWKSLAKLMTIELFGHWSDETNSYVHYRYCADMMYSGHTYVLSLFCLGIYELIRTCLFGGAKDPLATAKEKTLWRRVVYNVSVLLLLAIVGCELVLVVRNRFHYTMDILVSLILVLLFFTNLWIVIIAELWTTLLQPTKSTRFRGDVTIPICCVPFSVVGSGRSRWFIYERTKFSSVDYPELEGMTPVDR